jgi:GTP-binding protein HflX
MEQMRNADSRYQIGVGKVEELASLVKEKNVEKVIFDNRLRPVQAYNLAKATKVEVIDRFQLILEIFTRRAATTEAKLQIQLAQTRFELSRAKEKVNLAKKGEQPGFMGLGTYDVDVYHESIKKQVHTIRRKLKKIREKRELHRERRAELGFPTISLAGYTKAGKSSLFNALTESEAKVDASLFTTLSTTTRLLQISGKKLLLIDTVGFIDRLPLTLIEAFQSTLEETVYADLILLVIDIGESMDRVEKKLATCMETIEKIDASGVPIITVLNKIDLLTPEETKVRIEDLREKVTNIVAVSALKKTNIDALRREITALLKDSLQITFTIPMTKDTMQLISWLYDNTEVKKIDYSDDSVKVTFEASQEYAEKAENRIRRLNVKLERTVGQ